MSSTDAREQSGEPVAGEHAAPGGDEQPPGQALPARRHGHAADVPGAGSSAATGYRRRRPSWVLVLAVVVVVAAALGGADAAGVFNSPKPAASSNGYATGTEAVTRGSLTEQTQENGTLGDAGSYTVVVPGSSAGSGGPAGSSGSGASTFTSLPSAGQTIRQGQAIYQVSGSPVVLLYGNVPAYRDLSEGMTGADVTELNTGLVKLGYATASALGPRSGWDY